MGEVLLDANARLELKAKHVQSRRAVYFRDWQEVLIAASDGTFARDIRLTQSVGYNLLCADGAHRSSISKRAGNTSDPGFLRTWDYESAAEKWQNQRAYAGCRLRRVGTYPIVMANEFGGVIFHEACGHLLETTQIERKTTPFADKKGVHIAHESLTAWDEGLSPPPLGQLTWTMRGCLPNARC
jgi:TldD protein